ncbi:MAG: asparagine synthase-related protein, partial [Chthonomonadales bacterium]
MNRRIEIGGIAEFGDSSPFCIFVPDWLSKTSSVNTTRSQVRFLSSTRTGRTLAIAADAELHNKLDLASALGQPSLATSSDEELLIAAYSKWNEGCVKYLAGDYSFAIWDDSRKHLFCCRDHLGSRPFYYLWKASKFFFATDPRSIFEISGTAPELNRRKLADMAVFFSDCNYPEETLHSGIVGLPAATWLLVNERGIRQHTYWTPEILPDLVPPRPEDAFEALHHILSQSVENRIGDSRRVAVYFSGGLDSSALAALAATSLARGNHRLHALSSVLPTSHSPKLTDEREFIDEFRAWPNIDIEYISAPGRGPFDGIEDAARFALTPFVTSRTYLYDALEHGATADGDEVVL